MKKKYDETYDSYYDGTTGEWLESRCEDPACEHCSNRPKKAKMKKEPMLEIPHEVAANITKAYLQDYMLYLKKELKDHKKGSYMHPGDVVGNTYRVEIIKEILKDF